MACTYFSPILHLFFTYFLFHLLFIKHWQKHSCTCFSPIFHLLFTHFMFHLLLIKIGKKKHYSHGFHIVFTYVSPISHLFFTFFFYLLSINIDKKHFFTWFASFTYFYLSFHLCSFPSAIHQTLAKT